MCPYLRYILVSANELENNGIHHANPLPLQKDSMPSSRYTLFTTSHAEVREGTYFSELFFADLSMEN